MQEKTITPDQCRMARAALRWSVDDLAQAAGVGRATVIRFENDTGGKPATVARLREALEKARVQFIDEGRFAGGVYGGLRPAP